MSTSPLAPPLLATPPLGSLAAALSTAQQRCRGVPKDATNSYHRYKYASAEAVIAEAKAALADSGLALVPTSQAVVEKGQDRFELMRSFLLLHSSGESLPISVEWPIIVEKGRPLDKATAIGTTLSLAYLLRDLLLMPRVDPEDDLAARQPGEATPATGAASQPTAAAAPGSPQAVAPGSPQAVLPIQLAEIRHLKTELGLTDDQWKTAMAKRGVQSARELSQVTAQELIDRLTHLCNCKGMAEALKQAPPMRPAGEEVTAASADSKSA